METKCKITSVSPLFRSFGLVNFDGVDACGSKGGLWLGWRKGLHFEVKFKCSNFIVCFVKECNGRVWYLCCVYGEPNVELKGNIWAHLTYWIDSFDAPYLLLGDFNQVEFSWEKLSKTKGRIVGSDLFSEWKQDCRLIDIPSKGPQFTWCNNRRGVDRVYERLDKAFCCDQWLKMYPNVATRNFPIQLSDHAPVELDVQLTCSKKGRPYKLESWNFTRMECKELVENSWKMQWQGSMSFVLVRKLENVKYALKKWSLDKKKEWAKSWDDFDVSLEDAMNDACAGNGDDKYIDTHNSLLDFSRAAAIYWKQRSKIKWMKDGEACTKFYFNWVKGRQGKNFIYGIKKPDDQWCFDEAEFSPIFKQHFYNIYNPTGTLLDDDEYASKYMDFFSVECPMLGSDDVNVLSRDFTPQEVRTAVFQLGAMKSPGPDGIPAEFYHKYWAIIKNEVTNAVLYTLNSGRVLKEMNRTFIVLIPKTDNPELVENFRPISLCNVSMKIITKCITNRLKGVMNCLVGEFQNAFVPERHIIADNILIAHELLHHITNHKQGKKGRLAFKADMSKAYDRVNWQFVKFTLQKMGFPNHLIKLIMNCITSVSYEVLVNGRPTERFKPLCGLRQGDPLSPYLFVLCTELLSQNILRAQQRSMLRGVKIARRAVSISHLLFADDSLFFVQGDVDSIKCLDTILKVYCKASGQMINNAKSALLCSPSTTLQVASKALRTFNIPKGNKFGRYLGISTDFASSKKAIFNDLVEKVKKRILSWNGIFLAPAGRLTLINSVLSTISSYFLSVFKIPVSVANRINSLLAHFWWAGLKKGGTIHWCSKRILWLPKMCGGLGIRNIQCLNQALLAKTMWRIIMRPEILLSRLLRGKYLKERTFEDLLNTCLHVTNMSWGWKSVLWGLDLLNIALAWKIGAFSTTPLWNTKWVNASIPIPVSGTEFSNHLNIQSSLQVVADIQINGRQWNHALIKRLFDDDWYGKILAIPISSNSSSDDIFWSETNSGQYTVKSGYWVAVNNNIMPSLSSKDNSRIKFLSGYLQFGKLLWHLPGPHKWKIFLWKILTNTLPVQCELRKRNINIEPGCCLCASSDGEESLSHIFRDCSFTSHIWSCGILGIHTANNSVCSIQEWILNWIVYLYKKEKGIPRGQENSWDATMDFIATLWSIWIHRNEIRFQNSKPNPLVVMNYISDITNSAILAIKERNAEIKEVQERVGEVNSESEFRGEHDKLVVLTGMDGSCSSISIFVDAAWNNSRKAAAGWFYATCGGNYNDCSLNFWAENALQAEAYGLKAAIEWAKERGLLHVIIYTDCLQLLNQLANKSTLHHCLWSIAEDITELSSYFHCLVICFIPRSNNKRAHNLAKKAMGSIL